MTRKLPFITLNTTTITSIPKKSLSMIKTSFFSLLILFLLSSCTKETAQPSVTTETKTVTSYIDNYISLQNIQATQTGAKEVSITFSTAYENKLSKIQVLSGATDKVLCVFAETTATNTKQSQQYTIVDSPKQAVTYYMIKYIAANGDWNCSPVFKGTLQESFK